MEEVDFRATLFGGGWDRILLSVFAGFLIGVVIPPAWILRHVVPAQFYLPVIAGSAVIMATIVPLIGEGVFSSWAVPLPFLYQGLMLAACLGSESGGCAPPAPAENLWFSLLAAIFLGSTGYVLGASFERTRERLC